MNSSTRQLRLSGWLHEKDESSFSSSVKLQKFLLLYDLMALNDGESISSSHLRGYKNGPVYSDVYGDYTYEKAAFINACVEQFLNSANEVNVNRAICADFYIKTHTEKEISEMTHKLNLWNAKRDEIMSRQQNQVSLDINDYNENDRKFISRLVSVYGDPEINKKSVIAINDKYFALSENDARSLTEEQYDLLWDIAMNDADELVNPTYVEIAENGALIIDD